MAVRIDVNEAADDTRGNELSGISSIDDQSIPAHLPSAIKGLGSVERTLWFQVVALSGNLCGLLRTQSAIDKSAAVC